MSGRRDSEQGCVLITACNAQERIRWVIRGVLDHVPEVLVVDDGSADATAEEAQRGGATVLRHERRLGKGAALRTGFEHVLRQGRNFVVTMDGDGRHAAEDVPVFIEAYRRTGIPILLGNRMQDAGAIPLLRRALNALLTRAVCRAAGRYIPDALCGFRLYHCDVLPYIASEARTRAADTELLLHAVARGIRVDSVPVQVIYGRDQHGGAAALADMLEILRVLRRFQREYVFSAAAFPGARRAA
jgi:glycosyltransferase involved in cell wall biosynthesis